MPSCQRLFNPLDAPQLAVVIGVVGRVAHLHHASLTHGKPAHGEVIDVCLGLLLGGEAEPVGGPLTGGICNHFWTPGHCRSPFMLCSFSSSSKHCAHASRNLRRMTS